MEGFEEQEIELPEAQGVYGSAGRTPTTPGNSRRPAERMNMRDGVNAQILQGG